MNECRESEQQKANVKNKKKMLSKDNVNGDAAKMKKNFKLCNVLTEATAD